MSKRLGIIVSVIVAFILFIVVVISPFVHYHNSSVSKEEDIYKLSSNIETIVQKRSDTLTQLINSVKDSRKFEQETLTKLTEARVQAESGKVAESNMTLAAVAEAYPEIKTIDLYENVMNSTSSIENQLSSARSHYNTVVADYRKMYRSFPSSFVLKISGPEQKDFKLFENNQNAENYNPSSDNLWD